ncbi:MAG TPA: amino acid adenylation domain-containing protein, partial [Candidatus Deferrimicrobium sp.]|nr:amino acid adenylation domain-containing protein [Candidatus Deferrimicrobium sp.]
MEKIFQLWLNESLQRYGNNAAVEYGAGQAAVTATYAEISQHANYIAHWLLAKGIKEETFIGIYTTDRVRLIETITGILKARCVFVPLDPAHPDSRLASMVETAEIKLVICDDPEKHSFCQNQALKDRGVVFMPFAAIFSGSTSQADWYHESPAMTYSPEDKIYVYFTSGTTGKPKAIVGKNKSLFHFIEWEIETFAIKPGFRISQWITPGFDAYLRDIFTALCSGGVVCIPPPGPGDTLLNPDELVAWTDSQRIDLIHCVPSVFRMLNSPTLTPAHFPNLKYILLSGEKVTPAMLENWFRVFGERIRLVNFYGPSETTMIKTFHPIQTDDLKRERIPIGKPIKGCRVVILDDQMKICDQLVTGEIVIRTPYRTHGYYREAELNREKFIPNPLSHDPHDIVFRTGDLGRFLPDGNIEFLGRKDRQVKI